MSRGGGDGPGGQPGSVEGPFGDLRAALYSAGKRPLMNNYIYGLGGRDVTLDHIRTVYQDLEEMLRTGEVKREINYLGVRE